MTIDEIVPLEANLENYERKYGILSDTFYEAYSMGEEPADVPGFWIGTTWRERMKFGCAGINNIKT